MKIEIKDISTVLKQISVSLPLEETEKEEEKIISHLSKKAKIKGFRPGKIPKDIVKGRFKDTIMQEVSELLIQKHVKKILEDEKIVPLASPAVKEIDYQLGKPLSFKAEVETEPEYEIRNFDKLTVKPKKIKVTNEDIDSELQKLQRRAAEVHPVESRGLELNDIASIGGKATILDDKTRAIKISSRPYTLPSEKDKLSKFDEKLLGMKVNEENEFEILMDSDRLGKELYDKNAQFNITVSEIHHVHLPELDDEFAKSLGDFENLKDLKKKIKDSLSETKKEEERYRIGNEILDTLKKEGDFEIPAVYIEREIDAMLYRTAEQMVQMGMNPRHNPLDWQKMRGELNPKAIESVGRMMVVKKLAQQEKIEVSEDEIRSRISEIAQLHKTNSTKIESEMKKSGEYNSLKNEMLFSKTIDFLIEMNNIKYG